MKMLLKNIVPLFLICVMFIACNDWLTVDPQDKVSEEDMFGTVKGYESVLNGVYRNMAESDLYGNFLSLGLINVMSHTYDVSGSKSDIYKQAREYRYEEKEFKARNEALWRRAFNCIANANNLIQHLEKESDDFFSKELDQKNLMMGEAYAARAYVHFDLLRLYAPAPVVVDTNMTYIPYVDYYPCKFSEKLTVKEVLNKIVRDLQAARRYLAWDTLKGAGAVNFINQWDVPRSGKAANNLFYGHRATRLNFYATTALLARVLLYRDGKLYEDPVLRETQEDMPDREMAYLMANKVISDRTSTFAKVAEINHASLEDRTMIKMNKELVFALWRETQTQDVSTYYTSQSMNYVLADFTDLYRKSGNTGDYRNKYFIHHTPKGEPLTNRWWIRNKIVEDATIPMIRISELCYIAADGIFYKDKAKAIKALRDVRIARGLTSLLDAGMSREDFINYLIEDARKEFAGEGKMFFMYKYLNRKVIVKKGEEIELGGKFILPIPDSEFILK